MSVFGLGRTINFRHLADGGWIRVDNAAGAGFNCYLTGAAGDTYTLQEAQDSSGTGAKNLAVVTHYYTCTGDGSDQWVEHTQAAAATVVTTATAAQNNAWFEISSHALDTGFNYVKVTSTGAGLVTAFQLDLEEQRRPSKLPKLS